MKSKYIRLLTILLVLGIFAALPGTVYAAGEFTDSGSIGPVYREAVAEMARRGVLNGFPDGAFHPEETLTREQGAKIVTYMILGDQVNALRCDKAPFDDVASNRWSAPCIAWCVEQEILLGYGDGRYGPMDTLTGDQFSKMLLCALKLAREGNYAGLGSEWYSAVREDGKIAMLYEGDASMMTDQPITREQAALLAWNAVKAAEAEKPQPTVPAEPGGITPPPETEAPPDNSGDIETPEIDIGDGEDAVPENSDGENTGPPDTPEPPGDERPNNNDNGDILLPEVS